MSKKYILEMMPDLLYDEAKRYLKEKKQTLLYGGLLMNLFKHFCKMNPNITFFDCLRAVERLVLDGYVDIDNSDSINDIDSDIILIYKENSVLGSNRDTSSGLEEPTEFGNSVISESLSPSNKICPNCKKLMFIRNTSLGLNKVDYVCKNCNSEITSVFDIDGNNLTAETSWFSGVSNISLNKK